MRELWSFSLASWLALATPSSLAVAAERPPQTARGTIERVEAARLAVKGADGKTLGFALTAKTVFLRGEVKISRSALAVGERVAVEFEAAGQSRTALSVRTGLADETAAYSCPMHPEVVSDEPGRCPKCGMHLTAAGKQP